MYICIIYIYAHIYIYIYTYIYIFLYVGGHLSDSQHYITVTKQNITVYIICSTYNSIYYITVTVTYMVKTFRFDNLL